ncbi:MAG: shikimate dehydrogenase [Oscillospiraceae bacterium]|nr:shikimate dehydrogenase [Oscillospiraceae bacterium]
MKKYGLTGCPLGHSLSPQIHERLFAIDGIEADYSLYEIEADKLSEGVEKLFELSGFNVTIPYKGDIIPYLDRLHESAERYSSVNCVANMNGEHIGYNTDCDGFLRSIQAGGGDLSGDVLLCGCGGVGRMIAIECVRHGARLSVSVMEGFEDTVEPVREYAARNGIDTPIVTVHPGEIDLEPGYTLINATPVGMFPKTGAAPVSEEVISKSGFVFDVIYNPRKTLLMETAEKHGIKAVGGMAMLVYQAAVAHEIWVGKTYTDEEINGVIAAMYEML